MNGLKSLLLKSVVAAVATLSMTVGSNAAGLVIDDFQTAIPLSLNELRILGTTGSSNTYIQGPPSPVTLPIGTATRTAFVEVTADNGNSGNVVLAMPGSGDFLASSGANAAGLWRLTYNGFVSPVNLRPVSYSGIEIDFFTDIDLNDYLNISVTLTDSSNNTDTVTLLGLQSPAFSSATAFFRYDHFRDDVTDQFVDETQIVEIVVELEGVDINGNPQLEGDYGVEGLRSLPEPGTLVLLTIGSAAALMRRRK